MPANAVRQTEGLTRSGNYGCVGAYAKRRAKQVVAGRDSDLAAPIEGLLQDRRGIPFPIADFSKYVRFHFRILAQGANGGVLARL